MRLTSLTLCGLLLVCGTPCAAQGTEGPDSALAKARAAADAWLVLVDATQYDASWDSAAGPFRAAITRPAWQTAVLKARGPFGPIRRRALLGATYRTDLPGAPAGEYVVMQYESDVAGGHKVVETVTPMREPDGHWRVSGYYIRPKWAASSSRVRF